MSDKKSKIEMAVNNVGLIGKEPEFKKVVREKKEDKPDWSKPSTEALRMVTLMLQTKSGYDLKALHGELQALIVSRAQALDRCIQEGKTEEGDFNFADIVLLGTSYIDQLHEHMQYNH